MAKTPQRPDDDRDVADASFLFGDDPTGPPASPAPGRAPKPPAAQPADDDGYGLVGGPPADEDDAFAPAPPIPPPTTRARPARRRKDEDDEGSAPPEEAEVSQLWNRGAEWGPTLTLLGIVGLVWFVLVYYLVIVAGPFQLGMLVFLIGAVALVLLAYPIGITLERPVRMTPEQAAKDYYGALSHRFPHYRRMWLLLSDAGKDAFASFATFRAYWKRRLAEIRSGHVKGGAPLEFRVEEFKADKSAGKTAIRARFSVNVAPLADDAKPFAAFRVNAGFAKGDDNMWYLNEGKLA